MAPAAPIAFDAAMNDFPARPVLWRAVPHGRVVVFAPHPDDEVAGPGGVVALHRHQGDEVEVVVATDGTGGDPDGRHDPQVLAALRREESRRGLAEVGVPGDHVQFLGFPDGQVLSEADLERGVQVVAALLDWMRPEVVYLPWQHEGHPDHHALFTIVTRALDRGGFAGLALGYEVWNAMIPDVIVDTTPVAEQKRRAMQAHTSQIDYVTYDHCLMGLGAYRSLVHLRGKGYGEALCCVRGVLPAGLAVAGA